MSGCAHHGEIACNRLLFVFSLHREIADSIRSLVSNGLQKAEEFSE